MLPHCGARPLQLPLNALSFWPFLHTRVYAQLMSTQVLHGHGNLTSLRGPVERNENSTVDDEQQYVKCSSDDSAYASYSTPTRADFACIRAVPSVPDDGHRIEPVLSDSEQHHVSALGSDRAVTWTALPRKDQLFILTLARLAEPIVQTSLGAYVFYMLKSFNPELSSSDVSFRAGVLASSFTFTQCLTAMLWGYLADKEWMGRKNVLIIGLLGTMISCLGFGFSRSFYSAIVFRGLGGALNGNVGVMRTVRTLPLFWYPPSRLGTIKLISKAH